MRTFIKFLLVIFAISIVGILFLLGFVTLDNKEVMLISIILTIISILTSWLVSHIYSETSNKNAVKEVEEDHQAKLKTYALKAAEKVNNLSTELSKLSFYLQQELEQEYENPQLQNFAREERIKSAIHLIGTLKSVNDTSLSDWKGVIGEELEEQEEERKEQINELNDIIEKYEELLSDLRAENSEYSEEDNSNIEIKNELKNLKKDIGLIINNLSGTTTYRPKPNLSSKRQDVVKPCPNCQTSMTYRQKAKPSSFKKVVCSNCHEVYIGKWNNENEFYIEDEFIQNESVKCPWCEYLNIIEISNLPGTVNNCNCIKCNKSYRVVRTINSLNIKPISSQPVIPTPPIQASQSEEIINEVKNKLPHQPWPTGIHKQIAHELKIPNRQVNLVIQELIRRGDFKPQIDGIIYDPNNN